MDLSCAFPPGPDVLDHISLAESLGYRRAWLFDSPALYGDVWVTLARAADRTLRIGLGPAVLVPSLRHVITTAAAIATVEELAPGRLSVAIGTGFTGRRMLGQKPLTWRFVERYIHDLRALLSGGETVVEGSTIQLGQPDGYTVARPIHVPIIVAANGPKGLAVARELGDGVMCVGAPQPGFDWCSLLQFGTVLDQGEDFDSERVFEAVGPGIAVVYHGSYEASPEGVDALPGGPAWRAEIEKVPEAVRHLAVHQDHLVNITERDRPHLSPALTATTFTGTPDQLRARLAQLVKAGLTELLYAPMGPDVPRELEAMQKAVGRD